MPIVPFTIESLSDLDDGRISVAFAQELKRAVLDCMDRPGEKKARAVTLNFSLTPVTHEEGQCEGARGEFTIKSKVPDRKTRVYDFLADRKGNLKYSTESPENVDQTTIDEMDGEGRVRR